MMFRDGDEYDRSRSRSGANPRSEMTVISAPAPAPTPAPTPSPAPTPTASDPVGDARLVYRHFTEGGTGVSNISKERMPFFEHAVQAFGDPNLVLSSVPLVLPQPLVFDGGSLHCLDGRQDLSDFWRFVDYFKPVEPGELDPAVRENQSTWIRDLMAQLKALEAEDEEDPCF